MLCFLIARSLEVPAVYKHSGLFLQEMDCLEDNLENLGDECKKQVKNYIEEEEELPEINQIFMKACEPILKDQCKVSRSFVSIARSGFRDF